MAIKDPALDHALAAMAVPGILIGHRVIANGDEHALLPEEFSAFATSVIKVKRASGAARIVARGLLDKLGHMNFPILRSMSGAPIWPTGIVGSLTHNAEIAAAAVAMQRDYLSVGVDIEPALAFDPELVELIATKTERTEIEDDLVKARLLFAIKEAVYKAAFPLDGRFLEHQDVEVSIANLSATIRAGRIVAFRYCVAPQIVALAFIPASSPGHKDRRGNAI